MILHIDMDAFFASVEQLDNPALRGCCLVVGGGDNRGVVAAASYEARRFGIRSAMPIFQARQRCADLVIAPPRRRRYQQLSRRVMETLKTFSPLVEPVSIDEAYVDISGCHRLYGPPDRMARAVKQAVFDAVHLTCSAGVAPVRFVAKIASDLDKPDGLTVIDAVDMPAFLEQLPVAKVPGVGQKAGQVLARMGIATLGQVRRCSPDLLARRLGKFGHRLYELSCGKDETPVRCHIPAKSFSTEETLAANTDDRRLLRQHLLAQSQSVGRQLRCHAVRARTVTLKVKTADFKRITRSRTLDRPTGSSETIYRAAAGLLDALTLHRSVRLVGVGVSQLIAGKVPTQQCLFDAPAADDGKWEEVDRAVDAIGEKFGRQAVMRGSLAGSSTDKSD